MRITLLLIGLSLAFPVPAATYKWTDEKGVTHYGDTIPPQDVSRGMTEINKTGRVVKKTEPALTPEQLRVEEGELAKRTELAKQAKERRRRDVALVGTYTSEQEIDLARGRNTQQIDVTIRSAGERLASSQARLKELAQQIASYQDKDKAGKTRVPPPEVIEDMGQVQQQQTVLNAVIAELEKQKAQIGARFDEDKVRFREIKLAGVGSTPGVAESAKAERISVPFAINPTTSAVVNECVARWSVVSHYSNKNHAVSAEAVQHNGQTDLVLDGRVANKAGQLSVKRFVCPLTAEGKINRQETDIKKALASLGAQY